MSSSRTRRNGHASGDRVHPDSTASAGRSRSWLLPLAALQLLLASPAFAEQGYGWIGVQFGMSAPTGELGTNMGGGIQRGMFATYFESRQVGIGVDLAYFDWPSAEEPRSELARTGFGVDFRGIQTTAHVVVDMRNQGTLRPYAEVGFGVYWMRTDFTLNGRPFAGDWFANFGHFVGAGVDLHLGRGIALGTMGRYHVLRPGADEGRMFSVDLHLKRGNWATPGPAGPGER